jgi:hypothetical protein
MAVVTPARSSVCWIPDLALDSEQRFGCLACRRRAATSLGLKAPPWGCVWRNSR